MRADVPVAAYLSGGTRLVTDDRHDPAPHGHAARHTFSVRFQDTRYDEGEHQNTMAAFLGTNHTGA